MEAVKPIAAAAALVLLGGCFIFSTGRVSNVVRAPDDLRVTRPHVPDVSDLHPFGRDGLKAGQWARYAVHREAGDSILRIGVIRIDGDRIWIEIVEENRASARLVGPDGTVEKAYFREVGSTGPGDLYPQKIVQRSDTPDPAAAEETTEEREVEILGTKRKATVATAIVRDEALGRSEVEVTTWSDVPGLYASSRFGGLVHRKSEHEKLTVELIELGEGYAPIIADPK
jgi:hypothetical protein